MSANAASTLNRVRKLIFLIASSVVIFCPWLNGMLVPHCPSCQYFNKRCLRFFWPHVYGHRPSAIVWLPTVISDGRTIVPLRPRTTAPSTLTRVSAPCSAATTSLPTFGENRICSPLDKLRPSTSP